MQGAVTTVWDRTTRDSALPSSVVLNTKAVPGRASSFDLWHRTGGMDGSWRGIPRVNIEVNTTKNTADGQPTVVSRLLDMLGERAVEVIAAG